MNNQRPKHPKHLSVDDDEPPKLVTLVKDDPISQPISKKSTPDLQPSQYTEEQEKLQIIEAHLKYFIDKKKSYKQKQSPPATLRSPKKTNTLEKQSSQIPEVKLPEVKLPEGEFEKIKNLTQSFVDEAQKNSEMDLINNSKDEKQSLRARQKQIQLQLGNNNKTLNGEIDLIGQNIHLIERISILYKDKLCLRKKNELSMNLVSSLLTSFYELSTNLTNEIQILTKYYENLPNEREIKLIDQIQKMEKEIEKYNDISNQISSKSHYLENLSEEADEARQLIIQQLKQIQHLIKKDKIKSNEIIQTIPEKHFSPSKEQEKFQKIVKKVQIVESFTQNSKKLKENLNSSYISESNLLLFNYMKQRFRKI